MDEDSKVPTSAKKRPPGGSRKGIPNKVTASIKEMIEGALKQAGGIDYLTRQADENPAAFMGLVGKIVPKDLNVQAEVGPNAAHAIAEVMGRLFAPPKKDGE